jgi:membrane protein implicated in regulation of membrane protease activity
MEPYIVWALVGLGLVIVELLTGTFFLLMLGIAAFGGAMAAWVGAAFPVQAIVAALVAAAGCWGVHVYRAKNAGGQMPSIDAGQPASFESWIDEAARLARVRYRGASWDARIDGGEPLAAGAILYVKHTQGNTLAVTTQRPV